MARPNVGVLALQGDVAEHIAALACVDAEGIPVKTVAHLERVDALVIPGGESTTVMKLIERFGLADTIRRRVAAGMALWGTCMGLIVAAHDIAGVDQATLDLLDVTVRRNAFGRQNESAEVDLAIPALGAAPFPAIFIRAPWIERVGPGVQALAKRDGHVVMVRQGRVLGTSFHPELSADGRVHRYFLSMLHGDQRIGKASTAA
ncbi:MAG: pyridoxal 5'-phosphate synthase glutaminase subunit PdxT [Vulcanimicrobiaceae bacterium]